MNSTPDTQMVHEMKKKFNTLVTKPTTRVVRCVDHKYIEFFETIDYIWVSKTSKHKIVNLQILSDAEISPSKRNPSDHFALLMTIRK